MFAATLMWHRRAAVTLAAIAPDKSNYDLLQFDLMGDERECSFFCIEPASLPRLKAGEQSSQQLRALKAKQNFRLIRSRAASRWRSFKHGRARRS